jgi:hypothetical protein
VSTTAMACQRRRPARSSRDTPCSSATASSTAIPVSVRATRVFTTSTASTTTASAEKPTVNTVRGVTWERRQFIKSPAATVPPPASNR